MMLIPKFLQAWENKPKLDEYTETFFDRIFRFQNICETALEGAAEPRLLLRCRVE